MIKVDADLTRQVSSLDKEERTFVLSSFFELMRKMVDVFARYVDKNQTASPKVAMSVQLAQKEFAILKAQEKRETKVASEKDLGKIVDQAANSFLSEGPLTATTKKGSEGSLEFNRFPKGYEGAGKTWKDRAVERWKSHILHNYVQLFLYLLQGNRLVEYIIGYTKEEREMIGEEVAELIPARDLPCGEYALLKSGETRLADRLSNLDRRTYNEIFESLGYKKVEKADQPNDLLVYDENVHVYRYTGKGKVQSKHGNDCHYCLEEDCAAVVADSGSKLTVWRKPAPLS